MRRTHQSLHHVVAEAPWSDEAVLRQVREYVLGAMTEQGPVVAWVVEDTGFVKKGTHSVGVARQYRSLPHPLQTNGGQVFPKMQIDMFPRLERVDVDFDLPDAFLPEFPPAIFLSNRPELGDVSRGEVVSINNYYRLFKSILTPVHLMAKRFAPPGPKDSPLWRSNRRCNIQSLFTTTFLWITRLGQFQFPN